MCAPHRRVSPVAFQISWSVSVDVVSSSPAALFFLMAVYRQLVEVQGLPPLYEI